jgi:hypothetical protein
MVRLVLLFMTALLLSGCTSDNCFERGYIISHSEAEAESSSNSTDESP